VFVGCSGKGGATTTVSDTRGGSTPTFLGLYRVPSESMDPTVKLGARVPLETGTPRLGEIVVFRPPEGSIAEICGSATRIEPGGPPCSKSTSTESNIKFIKRIVAGPGDTLKVIEGHVIRNGHREADSYIRPCPGVAECNFPVAIKVPAGEWYLRHTFGSLLAAHGVDVVKIQKAMGHSALSTTSHYPHARPASEQAEAFTAAFMPDGATIAA